MHSRANIFTHT